MNLTHVIGPVMIGPSSSHTAGAARIGRIARQLLGEEVREADIVLHGSFAGTYKGHGTDRALLGGLMGLKEDDPALRRSLKTAAGVIKYTIRCENTPDAHPNTVILRLVGTGGRQMEIRAVSVGGSAILVEEIDGMRVRLDGRETSVVIFHRDEKGAASGITGALSEGGVNIATMSIFRQAQGGRALTALTTDSVPDEKVMQAIRAIPAVDRATLITDS